MKKFNKNSLIFIFAVGFILVGIWGQFFDNLSVSTGLLAGAVLLIIHSAGTGVNTALQAEYPFTRRVVGCVMVI